MKKPGTLPSKSQIKSCNKNKNCHILLWALYSFRFFCKKGTGKGYAPMAEINVLPIYNHNIFPNIHDMKVVSLHVAVEEYEKRSIRKHLVPQAG